MKTDLSKLALGAVLMFMTTSAIGYMSIDDRLDNLEIDMQEVSARNPQGTLGAGFATARPEVDGTNWFLSFDVIYWHPKMGGTEYAATYSPTDFTEVSPNTPTLAVTHRPHGRQKENDFSWDLGLKVGLGYRTPRDKWSVFARYTWFDTHSTSQTRKTFPSGIIPLKFPFTSSFSVSINDIPLNLNIYVNKAKSTVDIGYNNIDLELSRSYFLSKNFSVRPHISAKATWIGLKQQLLFVQDQNVAFSALLFDLSSPEVKVTLKSFFKGIGPRMGLDTKYFIGDDFNLFGEVAGSILYGHFKTSQKDFIPNYRFGGLLPPEFLEEFAALFNLLISSPSRNLTNKFHQFVSFAQMQLGLEWNKYLNNNKQHLGLKVGYEVHYYWRANQMEDTGNAVNATALTVVQLNPIIITGSPRGRQANHKISEDLMFYGITAEARLDF